MAERDTLGFPYALTGELADSMIRARLGSALKPSDPVIYFIGCQGCVKVGTTRCIESRLAALQCGNPRDLTLLALFKGDQKVERALHRLLLPYRERGEWFRLEPPVRHFIERHRGVIDG